MTVIPIAIVDRKIIICRPREKRIHESMYKIDTKKETRLRATTLAIRMLKVQLLNGEQ